ncbi:MAG: 4Fe-4S dicluster domain-containing protein [candidate division Zixibacteria bacterium]|nr:4Fe-4S dicluster domain-containing protein [candidate division Zixibacteria bacterium]
MTQYAMVIDLNRCVGCHACAIACKAEWGVPAEYHRSWLRRLGPAMTPDGMSYTYFPGLCNHCDDPVCVPVCEADPEEKVFTDPKTGKTMTMEVRATYKHPFTGAVLIDHDRCIGCEMCVDACPYGARYMDYTLDEPKADKCTFCMERVEHGEVPACVKTCLAGARIFGDLHDKKSEVYDLVHNKGAIRLTSSEVVIGPNVYYIGNPRDLHLLKETCTPHKMNAGRTSRRAMLAGLHRRGGNLLAGAGLFGAVAGLVDLTSSDSNSEDKSF